MKSEFSITFLGTGTSQGVPVIGCNCKVCISNNEKDNRLRSSLLISINGKNIVVDSGPDFRQQMLRNNITDIRAILFTHEHKDHVAGLDDVRPYNYIHDKPIDIYAENRVHITLKREFAYIFSENPYPGIPRIEMHLINEDSFNIDEINIIPIRAYHHKFIGSA